MLYAARKSCEAQGCPRMSCQSFLILARILIASVHRLPALFIWADHFQLNIDHASKTLPSPTRALYSADTCANFSNRRQLDTMLLEPKPLAFAASAELDTDAVRYRDSGMVDSIHVSLRSEKKCANWIQQGGSWHTCKLRNEIYQ